VCPGSGARYDFEDEWVRQNQQSNILWIDSLANISRQETELAQSKSAKLNAEELVDRVFYIRNLPAQEIMTSLMQFKSLEG